MARVCERQVQIIIDLKPIQFWKPHISDFLLVDLASRCFFLPMSIAPPAYVSSDEEDAEITAHNVRSVPYRAPPPGLEPPAGR